MHCRIHVRIGKEIIQWKNWRDICTNVSDRFPRDLQHFSKSFSLYISVENIEKSLAFFSPQNPMTITFFANVHSDFFFTHRRSRWVPKNNREKSFREKSPKEFFNAPMFCITGWFGVCTLSDGVSLCARLTVRKWQCTRGTKNQRVSYTQAYTIRLRIRGWIKAYEGLN